MDTRVTETRGAIAAAMDAEGSTSPILGMNLGGVTSWAPAMPFLNVMKTAKPWNVSRQNHEGSNEGYDYADLKALGHVDGSGAIVSVPDDARFIEAVVFRGHAKRGVNILNEERNALVDELDVPAISAAAGTFVLTWTGDAEISLRVRDGVEILEETRTETGGEIVFHRELDAREVKIRVHSVGEEGLTDIAVVDQDLIELHEAGQIFHPGLIARVEDLGLLRMMDWSHTNNSKVATTDDLSAPSDLFWTAGIPVEVQVALANEVGADVWLNIPHLADDALIEATAAYVRDNLDPELKAHFEFSNEVWNWGFKQAREVREETPDGLKPIQAYGYQAANMARIVRDAFGEEGDARLSIELGTQASNIGATHHSVKGAAAYAAEHGLDVSALFDGLAVTGYFGRGIETPKDKKEGNLASQALLQAWIDEHGMDRAMEMMGENLLGERAGPIPEARTLIGLQAKWEAQKEVAEAHGWTLSMYEGGSHLLNGYNKNDALENPDLIEFFVRYAHSDQIVEVYDAATAAWQALGGTGTFTKFTDIGAVGLGGAAWGTYRNPDDENAVAEFFQEYTVSGERHDGRSGEVFQQGVTLFGGEAGDVLVGTVQEDTLAGREGDDVLIGGAEDDRLHGGEGLDLAVYDGTLADALIGEEDGRVTVETATGRDLLVDVEGLFFAASGEIVALDGGDAGRFEALIAETSEDWLSVAADEDAPSDDGDADDGSASSFGDDDGPDAEAETTVEVADLGEGVFHVDRDEGVSVRAVTRRRAESLDEEGELDAGGWAVGEDDEALFWSADALILTGGDDRYVGVGRIAPTVVLGGGDDKARGGSQDDDLRGQEGSDKLAGGRGADVISGGAGNDQLRGGGGADTFVFADTAFDGQTDRDRISDFDAGEDMLRLGDADIADVRHLNGHTILTLTGDGDVIKLRQTEVVEDELILV